MMPKTQFLIGFSGHRIFATGAHAGRQRPRSTTPTRCGKRAASQALAHIVEHLDLRLGLSSPETPCKKIVDAAYDDYSPVKDAMELPAPSCATAGWLWDLAAKYAATTADVSNREQLVAAPVQFKAKSKDPQLND